MARTKKLLKEKPLAVLSEEDRFEYHLRHNLILQKQVEYQALVDSQDSFRDTLIEKYGLPDRFDLTLATGECFPRPDVPPEGGSNAENGSV